VTAAQKSAEGLVEGRLGRGKNGLYCIFEFGGGWRLEAFGLGGSVQRRTCGQLARFPAARSALWQLSFFLPSREISPGLCRPVPARGVSPCPFSREPRVANESNGLVFQTSTSSCPRRREGGGAEVEEIDGDYEAAEAGGHGIHPG